ncbi:hypothetical protein [uncultured Methylophaga sp.]|uniref:hypothetical protein n=1 Tax=uncultured Methylophaga sp. TaxID=285271 RepID=UPI0030FBC983
MKLKHEIRYGDWVITNDDTYRGVYMWIHDGYDGAPDANDTRHGVAYTIDQAIDAINDWEYENSPPHMLQEQAP